MLNPHNVIVCALCDKQFSRNHSFVRHNRMHHDPTMVDQLNSELLELDDKIVDLCGLQATGKSPEATNSISSDIVSEQVQLTSSFGHLSSNTSSPRDLTNPYSDNTNNPPYFSTTCSDTCSPGSLGISSIHSDNSFISSYPSLPSCGSFTIWSSELPQFKHLQQLQRQQQQQRLSHQEHPVHKMSIEFLIDSVL